MFFVVVVKILWGRGGDFVPPPFRGVLVVVVVAHPSPTPSPPLPYPLPPPQKKGEKEGGRRGEKRVGGGNVLI